MQPVRAAFKLAAPASHEAAVIVEYQHSLVIKAALAHGVFDEYAALAIHRHAVRIAKAKAVRKLAPIVDNLVSIFAYADDRSGRATLVTPANGERRGDGDRSTPGGFQKLATANLINNIFHHARRLYPNSRMAGNATLGVYRLWRAARASCRPHIRQPCSHGAVNDIRLPDTASVVETLQGVG